MSFDTMLVQIVSISSDIFKIHKAPPHVAHQLSCIVWEKKNPKIQAVFYACIASVYSVSPAHPLTLPLIHCCLVFHCWPLTAKPYPKPVKQPMGIYILNMYVFHNISYVQSISFREFTEDLLSCSNGQTRIFFFVAPYLSVLLYFMIVRCIYYLKDQQSFFNVYIYMYMYVFIKKDWTVGQFILPSRNMYSIVLERTQKLTSSKQAHKQCNISNN